jgi:hypothetical protein
MSEVLTDKLTGRGTAKTVTVTVGATLTQSLEQGLAKAWVASEGEATPSLRTSLNHSSVTDNGVGDQTFTYTNNFSAIGVLTAGTYHNAVVVMHQILTRSTSTHGVKTHDHASTPEDDLGKKHAVFGDLA